jgi:hypothetical protein
MSSASSASGSGGTASSIPEAYQCNAGRHRGPTAAMWLGELARGPHGGMEPAIWLGQERSAVYWQEEKDPSDEVD